MDCADAVTLIRLLLFIGLAQGFDCPAQYNPYSSGISCISITDSQYNYDDATAYAASVGGQLADVHTSLDLVTLTYYAESKGVMIAVWVNDSSSSCSVINNYNIEPHNCSDTLPAAVMLSYNFSAMDISFEIGPQYLVPYMDYTITAPVVVPDSLNITWLLNNSSSTVNNTNKTTIVIADFEPDNDTGLYIMLASNEVFSTVLYMLDIREAVLMPFTVMPSNVSSPLGNMAAFECEQANSYPAPTIVWLDPSNSEIVDGPTDRVHISPIGTLYVQDVRTSDAGEYTCIASNTVGMNTTSAWLSVVDKPTTNTSNITLILEPRDQLVLKGDSYTLECSVLISKNFELTDLLLYRVIEHFTQDEPQEFTFVYMPSFPVVPYSDMGVVKDKTYFECLVQATMSSGQSNAQTVIMFSETAVILLQCPALVLSLTSSYSSTVIPVGTSVVLNCTYEGIPDPTVTWVYNGIQHYNGTHNAVGQSIFSISSFQINQVGVYQCIVENEYQYSSQSVSFYVKDGQPGVVAFNAVALNSSTLYINWTEPQDINTISELLVRYNLSVVSSSGVILDVLLPYDRRNYTIYNLNDATYSVSVTAYNSEGRGSEGDVISVTLITPATTTPVVVTTSSVRSVSTSTTTSMAITGATTSVIGTPPVPSGDNTTIIILAVVFSFLVLIVLVIVLCIIIVYLWWKLKVAKGNYSPEEMEERRVRETMLNLPATPVTPPAHMVPLTMFPSTSDVSVEVIQVGDHSNSTEQLNED